MDNIIKLEDTDSKHIAHYCIRCGKCCTVLATSYTHEEIIEMAKKNEQEAIVFVEMFKRYNSIADAKKVHDDTVRRILKNKGFSEDYSGNEVTFYYCPHKLPDNSCPQYDKRPTCCKQAPNNEWCVMPPKCGYSGWQFEKREQTKANIRSLKEKVYETEILFGEDAFIEEINMPLKELKNLLEEKIKPFEKYGAKGW